MAIKFDEKDIQNIVYNGKRIERFFYNGKEINTNKIYRFSSDKSCIGQTELNYECGIGEAKVNLYTGRLLFAHSDIVIGAGNFQFGVKHIYNNKWIEMQESDFSSMGKGWKLNIQQYCYPYTENEVEEGIGFMKGDYIYIDADGYKHRFIEYKKVDNEIYYYDESGSCLILKKKANNTLEISGQTGDIIIFNENGEAISFVSGKSKNRNIEKVITYKNGLIDTVFDTRKKSRYIQFIYNNDGLLSEIVCYENNVIKKRLDYFYDDNSCLVEIQVTMNGNTKTVAWFSYEDAKLSFAVDAENKTALGASYNKKGKVIEMKTGIAEISNEEISMQDKSVKSNNSIIYNEFETIITNEKNLRFIYQFNSKGYTSAAFEQNGLNYRTLSKKKGWSLWESGNTPFAINGNQTYSFSNNVFQISERKIKEFLNIFGRDGDKYIYCESYILSFWVKLKTTSVNDIKAKLKISTTNERDVHLTFESLIDKTAYNVWQYVTIPIDFQLKEADDDEYFDYSSDYIADWVSLYKRHITDMKLLFDGAPDNSSIEIADIQIELGNTSRILLGSRYLDCAQEIECDSENGLMHFKVGSDFYLTEKDLILTYKNRYFQENKSKDFDLVACNGTKRIPITDMRFYYTKNDNEYFGRFPEINTFFETKVRVGQKEWHVSKVYFSFYEDYYVKHFAIDNRSDFYERNQNDETETYEAYYYNGLIKETRDSYGVITRYTYDSLGNLEEIETFNVNETDKKLIKKFVYDASAVEEKEVVTNTSENGIEFQECFDSPFFNQQNSTLLYGVPPLYVKHNIYDEFEEKILEVRALGSDNTEIRNTLSYDDANGCLNEVMDSFGYHYKFDYDLFGNPISCRALYENGTESELLKREYNYNDENSNYCVITDYYLSQSDVNKKISIFNKYNKAIVIEDGNNMTKYSYQDIGESNFVAEIDSIYDPYTKQKYIYNYDSNNSLNEFEFKPEEDGENIGLAIYQVGQNTTKYIFRNEENESVRIFTHIYEDSEVEKGNKVYINPHIRRTIDSEDNSDSEDESDSESETDSEYFNFCYEYDGLGRLSKQINYEGTHVYSYVYNSDGRIKEINLRNDDYGFKYEYDSLGNIKKIRESLLDVAYLDFEYDTYNRLVCESNQSLKIFRNYYYDNKGRCSLVYNNGELEKKYTYDNKNRLKKFEFDDFEFSYTYGSDEKVNKVVIKRNYQTKEFSLSWERDKLLTRYGDNYYFYNCHGVRYKKIVNGITKHYYLAGDIILGEDWSDGTQIRYFYDANNVTGFSYNGEKYYYIRDLQQNIRAIQKDCDIICLYDYDAYGHCRIRSKNNLYIGTINPFRWKSYYYDEETNLYLISSRYYDPECGLFLQPADVLSLNPTVINGLNLYTYNSNNPINLKYDVGEKGKYDGSTPTIKYNDSELDVTPSILYDIFGYVQNGFSVLDGIVYAYRNIKGLSKINSLNKISTGLMIAGTVLGVIVDVYNNFSNPDLTLKQKIIGTSVDAIYTVTSAGLSYFVALGASALIALIPGFGPVALLGGALVAIGVGLFVDWLVDKIGLLDSIKTWIESW